MIDILAIGAHPDDVELACSGTLLHHAALGHTFAIVDLTAGELGTRGSAETRAVEAADAAQILGAKKRINLGLKDGFFLPDEANLRKLIEAIRYFKPRIVLANAIDDRHPDHGKGADFISRACFLSGLPKIETAFQGQPQEAHRPAAVYHFIQDRFIKPDLVVDITPYYDTKMKAIMAFKSQFYNPNSAEPQTPISSNEFMAAHMGRARDIGRIISAEFGEGFTVERAPGIKNFLDLI
jgi:bacillithiol biosynthesis deacetylase BshB1